MKREFDCFLGDIFLLYGRGPPKLQCSITRSLHLYSGTALSSTRITPSTHNLSGLWGSGQALTFNIQPFKSAWIINPTYKRYTVQRTIQFIGLLNNLHEPSCRKPHPPSLWTHPLHPPRSPLSWHPLRVSCNRPAQHHPVQLKYSQQPVQVQKLLRILLAIKYVQIACTHEQ